MPVCVHIPIRIRIDTKTVYARCACIDEALTKAVTRALDNSRTIVLEPRGGYAGLCLHSPEFNWTGSGAPQVPETRREQLEQRWTEILMSVVDTVGLADFAAAGAEAPMPIPPNPSEILDPSRLHGNWYEVPSYGDDDEPDPPAIDYGEEDDPNRSLPLGFRNYSSAVDVARDFLFKIRAIFGRMPESGHLAVLYKWAGQFQLAILRFPGPVTVDEQTVGTFTVDRKGKVVTTGTLFRPSADYELVWFSEASTTEDYERIIYALRADRFKDMLRDTGRPHEDADVKAVIKEFIKAGATPPGTAGFSTLLVDGFDEYLIAAKPNWPRETIRIIPLVFPGEGETAAEAPEEGGTGKEGGTKDGMRECESEPVKVASVTIDNIEYDWGPFECEPPMYQLEKNGDYMRELMRKVANMLHIPECEYAGRFCIEATKVIGMRQYAAYYQALSDEGELQPSPGGKGNLGAVHFTPKATPSIVTLRDLASIIPEITHLEAFTMTTYEVPKYSKLLGKWYTSQSGSWELRFIPEMMDAMNHTIGAMFISACFSVLMQLMRASHKGIKDRIGNDDYAAKFELLIKNEILPLDYLKRLRDQLSPWTHKWFAGVAAAESEQTWEQSSNRIVEMFGGRSSPFTDVFPGMAGYLVRESGTFKIKDSSGALWSLDDLDAEIALRTAVSEGIDPLVIQITADSEILSRFARNPDHIKEELAKLLKEMLDANEDKMQEAQDDPYFAFGATKIYEAATRFTGTAGSGYELTGLHKQAHDLIFDAFKGDTHYQQAVKNLFDTEEGKNAIVGFIEFVGVVFLCVVCPPLGVAAGIGTSLYHLHEAHEEQKLFRGLLDPEMVITRAELETDLFCARLAVVLSVVPEGGKVAEGAITGGRALLKKELKTAITALGKAAAKGIAEELLKNLEKSILSRFVSEFIKAQVISQFVSKLVIEPVAEQIYADFEKTLVAKSLVTGQE